MANTLEQFKQLKSTHEMFHSCRNCGALQGVHGNASLGCVCVCVRAPLVPRHSWLGCVVWVCVLGLGFRLRPATPGWGVGVCVCLCTRSACTPPLLAGVCGVGVCAGARVSAAPRHSWLGCWDVCLFVCVIRLYPATPGWGVWCGCVCLGSGFGCALPVLAGVFGCVCVCVRAPLVPRHSWLGLVVCGLAVARRLFLCRGSLRVVLAARVCGIRCPLLLGTCPCSVVVAGGVPLWRALWPRVGAPRLVRYGRSRCSGRLSDAVVPFPIPGAWPPGFTGRLRRARGGRLRTGLFVPAAGPRPGRGSRLAPRRTRSGPRDGVVPAGSLWRRS